MRLFVPTALYGKVGSKRSSLMACAGSTFVGSLTDRGRVSPGLKLCVFSARITGSQLKLHASARQIENFFCQKATEVLRKLPAPNLRPRLQSWPMSIASHL